MVYPSEGTLTTDEREIAVSESWESQTDWEAYQSINGIDIDTGTLKLNEQILLDNGILLDDWYDNRLTDRDQSVEGQLLDIEPDEADTDFEDPIVRPDWSTENDVDAQNESIELTSDGSTPVAHTPTNEFANVWVIDWQFLDFDSSGGNFNMNILDTGDGIGNNTSGRLDNGYLIDAADGGAYRLAEITNGSFNTLINGSWPQDNEPHTTRVERNGDSWELYLDGSSVGTANDDTYVDSDINRTSVNIQDDDGHTVSIDTLSIY